MKNKERGLESPGVSEKSGGFGVAKGGAKPLKLTLPFAATTRTGKDSSTRDLSTRSPVDLGHPETLEAALGRRRRFNRLSVADGLSASGRDGVRPSGTRAIASPSRDATDQRR